MVATGIKSRVMLDLNELVDKKLEEISEKQQLDSLKVNDKINHIVSEYRSKGVHLREEISLLEQSVHQLELGEKRAPQEGPPNLVHTEVDM